MILEKKASEELLQNVEERSAFDCACVHALHFFFITLTCTRVLGTQAWECADTAFANTFYKSMLITTQKWNAPSHFWDLNTLSKTNGCFTTSCFFGNSTDAFLPTETNSEEEKPISKTPTFRMFSYKQGRFGSALSKEYRSGLEAFGDRAHCRLDRNKKPRMKRLWHPVSVLLKTGQKQRKQGQGKQVRLLL